MRFPIFSFLSRHYIISVVATLNCGSPLKIPDKKVLRLSRSTCLLGTRSQRELGTTVARQDLELPMSYNFPEGIERIKSQE